MTSWVPFILSNKWSFFQKTIIRVQEFFFRCRKALQWSNFAFHNFCKRLEHYYWSTQKYVFFLLFNGVGARWRVLFKFCLLIILPSLTFISYFLCLIFYPFWNQYFFFKVSPFLAFKGDNYKESNQEIGKEVIPKI